MTLLEQCQIWNENDEYQKIIDTIEAIPEEKLTPELCSELARAYNNAANIGDREMFEKALASHASGQGSQNDHRCGQRRSQAKPMDLHNGTSCILAVRPIYTVLV